ncbi:DNA polymerase III subunit beta [Neorhizobium sp. JUb45]|uniref:DNA polymerase III subunit beta n=1 Tax=Neorhizobium sp. JUb45 TaxID=2485113 RepID=UPI0010503487|nr:DNA polymerase III subunit beta [Neorhizobium sp. JUb45]TCR07232.1 DNA polymerase-3 subunit beta [Neorhizobium sp. JUb45]
MQLKTSRTELARVVGAVGKVIESRTTIPILSNILLEAEGDRLRLTGTDLDIQATASAEATIAEPGRVTVSAKLLGDIVRKAGADDISLDLKDGRLTVKSGRSRFTLETLPASDYPDLAVGTYSAEFEIDLAALFAPVSFAISTEETRYYLNGAFFHSEEGARSVAVATDGHRLARNRGPELPAFAGIIVPRKTVGLLPKGSAKVSVSDTKIRIESAGFLMVSKLIDGTFPDYRRVIPQNNDKTIVVDRDEMMRASDRVVTVSSERGRAVKLSVAPGSIALAARSDAGAAEDEVAAEYSGEPFVIGFNSQYVRDLFNVLPAGPVTINAADGGSPAIITGGLDGWDGVLMPMRV